MSDEMDEVAPWNPAADYQHEHCDHCGQPIDVEGMMRVTVDEPGVYIEAAMFGLDAVKDFANAVKPLGWTVVASPLVHDHD